MEERVERPWGFYQVIAEGETFKTKLLGVYPHSRLSKQYHERRSETWMIVEGRAMITIDEKQLIHGPSDFVRIPQGAVHRVENIGEDLLLILELQRGTYFGEDDIVRLEDDWGRE